MEILFKKGEEVVERFTEQDIYEKEDELKEKYNNESVKSYELNFKRGIKVVDVHDLQSIEPEDCLSLVLTLYEDKL